jgi:hypothetical protein
VDQNVTNKPPRTVASRFELAAPRMADAWLRAGRVTVSRTDLSLACDFLREAGWRVARADGGLIRLHRKHGRARAVTPEAVVLLALRRLVRSE